MTVKNSARGSLYAYEYEYNNSECKVFERIVKAAITRHLRVQQSSLPLGYLIECLFGSRISWSIAYLKFALMMLSPNFHEVVLLVHFYI